MPASATSSLKNIFLKPPIPNVAAGFISGTFVVVDLRKSRNGLALASSALTPVPEGLLTPAFEGANIQDEEQLAQIITQTVEAAGLSNRKRWSVALPDAAARTVIITVEGKPSGRSELNELISWKTERAIGIPSSNLKIGRQSLSRSRGQERYLVTAAREDVLAEYESLFRRVGWQAGLILPKHLGEAQWLISAGTSLERMLVSSSETGFNSMVIRKGEPVLVRSHECDQGAITDELYRFALFYKDRLAESDSLAPAAKIDELLVVGDIDRADAMKAVTDAIGESPRLASSNDYGLDLSSEPVRFDQLAAVAGLCTLAWN